MSSLTAVSSLRLVGEQQERSSTRHNGIMSLSVSIIRYIKLTSISA